MNFKAKKETKEDRFDKSENKGITIIALVITIIVLLILAGVSMATLTGNNGIITQAGKAKEQTEMKNENERIELATLNAMEKNKYGELEYDKLKKELENNGFEVTDENFKSTTNGYTFNGTKYKKYMISDEGEIKTITKDALFYSELKIGKKVIYTGYEDENTYSNEWSVYYADDKNVFLILKQGFNETLSNKTSSKDGNFKYNGIADIYNETYKERFPIIKSGWLNYITDPKITKAPFCFPAIEYLLDSNNWKSFENEYTEYAVGATTIELMEQSLRREREQIGENIPVLTVNVDDTLQYPGYELSLSSDIPLNSINYNIGLTTAYCGGSDYYELKSWKIAKNTIGKSNWGNTAITRPIVCLKSDVIFYENDENSYKISLEK